MSCPAIKKKYKYDVLNIFLDNTVPGIEELKELVKNSGDYTAISKQAHFLKSSFSIIQVEGVYDKLAQIEKLAPETKDKATIQPIMDEIAATFDKAHAILIEERDKNAPD